MTDEMRVGGCCRGPHRDAGRGKWSSTDRSISSPEEVLYNVSAICLNVAEIEFLTV